ncbi:unannotated protein [freshwater metagenome]|uniref:Unannotated protein n=1 Tax=freshwater metagenome TaxID=449393 RepID=A0A6J7E2I0_9ZZZZ
MCRTFTPSAISTTSGKSEEFALVKMSTSIPAFAILLALSTT